MSKITNFLLLSFLSGLLLTFSSCTSDTPAVEGLVGKSGTTNVTAFVPNTATNLGVINLRKILDKADYTAVQQMAFFKDWANQNIGDNPKLMEILQDPALSGVDINGDVAYFSTNNDDGVVLLPVADKAKMDAAIQNLNTSGDLPSEQKEGYTLVTFSKKSFLVYNDKIAILMPVNNATRIQSILDAEAANGIQQNEAFAKSYQDRKDIFTWSADDDMLVAMLEKERPEVLTFLNLAQIPTEQLRGNAMSSNFEFQDGRMVGNTTLHINDALQNNLGRLVPNKLTSNYAATFPTDNLLAALTLGIDPSKLATQIANRGSEQVASMTTEQLMGLSIGQIKAALVGDMAIAVYGGEKPAALLVIGIKDESLIENALRTLGAEKKGTEWQFKASMQGVENNPFVYTIRIKDNMLYAATEVTLLEKAMTGGHDNNTVKQLSDGWMGFYLDKKNIDANNESITKLLKFNIMDATKEAKLSDLATIQLVVKDNVASSSIDLVKKDENALKVIIQYLESKYQEKQAIEDEFEEFEEF